MNVFVRERFDCYQNIFVTFFFWLNRSREDDRVWEQRAREIERGREK